MTKKQEHIVIIGTGKVALHLGLHLKETQHTIKGVWGRNKLASTKLANILNTSVIPTLEQFPENALALICISDFAIADIIEQLPKNIKIAYTSGSIKIEDLPTRKDLGVFYPLQTFSKDKKVDISVVPFLIEATNKNFESYLVNLGKSLSSKVIIANSEDRYNTHIAAVMVNNFTNFLYHLAQQHLNAHQLDFDLLKPLIKETVEKLDTLSPLEAQTGPAARGDINIIKKHLKSISQTKTQQVYKLFSELIEKEINNEL